MRTIFYAFAVLLLTGTYFAQAQDRPTYKVKPLTSEDIASDPRVVSGGNKKCEYHLAACRCRQ